MNTMSFDLTSDKAVQHAWFEINRDPTFKGCLGLIPVEEHESTVPLAHAFAALAALDLEASVLMLTVRGGRGPERLPERLGERQAECGGGRYDCLEIQDDMPWQIAVSLHGKISFQEWIQKNIGSYTHVIVAFPSLPMVPEAVALARSVDSLLLCVVLNSSRLDHARTLVAWLGEDNIVGAITLSGMITNEISQSLETNLNVENVAPAGRRPDVFRLRQPQSPRIEA